VRSCCRPSHEPPVRHVIRDLFCHTDFRCTRGKRGERVQRNATRPGKFQDYNSSSRRQTNTYFRKRCARNTVIANRAVPPLRQVKKKNDRSIHFSNVSSRSGYTRVRAHVSARRVTGGPNYRRQRRNLLYTERKSRRTKRTRRRRKPRCGKCR